MSPSLKREPYGYCIIVKPDPSKDLFVAQTLYGTDEWSGTYTEAMELGIDHGRLTRAALTGSSSRTGAFAWEESK